MPRELVFQLKRKEYRTIPTKVDRKKLYGWTEILALDEEGRECKLVTTDQTGTLIVPKGGTAMAILSPRGEWVERSELKTVKEDGTPADIIPSSYSVVIKLSEKITEEEFLDYSITDFYELDNSELIKPVGKDIYRFDYSYLDSYESTPAFIMVAGESVFMMIGYRNKFDMLCLGDCEVVDDDDDYILIDDDDIDFSMF